MTAPDDAGREVVITRSGARAIHDRGTGELMHPIVGPLVEAEQLYVGPSRLRERLGDGEASPLVLLDVGLGAGSNAIAAWRAAEESGRAGRRLDLVSFDRTTAAMELALKEENAEAFGFGGEAGRAGRALLDAGRAEDGRVSWRLALGDLPDTLERDLVGPADVVFWDPFSPKSNPSLWTVSAFALLRRRCGARATVHTYSAATRVRAALLLAGFAVGIGAAIEGKPTTMAATQVDDLERPLDRRWLERLRRSTAPFPEDAAPDALERAAAAPQFG